MVMKSANYIYVITRTHGLSTHLFDSETIVSLARSPSLQVFMEHVMKGDYMEKIGFLSPERITARDLIGVFSEVYVSRLLYIIRIASGETKKFLDSFARRVEVDNIRKIVRSKFYDLEIGTEDLIPLPRTFSLINYPAMVEAVSLEDALNILGFTIYRDLVNKVSVSREIGSTIPLEAYLDSIYFKNLFKAIKRVPDKNVVEMVVGTEIDFRNIFYLLAYKLLDVKPRIVEESVIRPTYRFTLDEIGSLIRARVDNALDVLSHTKYGWLSFHLSDAWYEKSIDSLELSFAKQFKDFLDKIAVRNPLGLGYVLWYLYSIGFEFTNLIAIAVGKQLGLDFDKINLII